MSRELRATFASVFALFFLTIIVIVGSIDMRSPIPILVEALLVGGTVTLAYGPARQNIAPVPPNNPAPESQTENIQQRKLPTLDLSSPLGQKTL